MTREVFEERGIDVTLPETFDPSVAPETLYERGIAKHQELMPDVFGYHPTAPTPVDCENCASKMPIFRHCTAKTH